MLQIIHNFGYLGIIFTIFGEVGAMMFFLPGDTLIFGSGILSSNGLINFYICILVIFLTSAVAGEFGYYVGTKLTKHTLQHNKYYKVEPKYLEKTEKFFEKYGALAIIFSRFVPIVRNFISQICGTLKYDRKKFFIYNLLASFLWPTVTVSLGYYFGQTFPNLIRYMEMFMIVMVIIVALPFIFQIGKRIFRKIFN